MSVRHSRRSATELELTVPAKIRSGRLRMTNAVGPATITDTRFRLLRGAVPQATTGGPTVDLKPGEPLIAGSRRRAAFRYSAPTASTVEAVRVGDGAIVRSWPVAAGEGEVHWDGTVSGVVVPDGRATTSPVWRRWCRSSR